MTVILGSNRSAIPAPRRGSGVFERARTVTEPALRAAVDSLPPTTRRVLGYHFGWWDSKGNDRHGTPGKAVRPALVLVAAEAVGFAMVSRYVPRRWRVADGDAAGTVYSTIGMVYAILIAIAAIAVWEPRADVASNTEAEASSLVEAYWSANRLSGADKDDVQRLIVGYLQVAGGSEWEHLRTAHTGTMTAEDLSTELRERVDTIGGAMVSVGFLYLFGLRCTVPNGLMFAALGGMVALMLFVLYQVELPYSRGFAVDPGSLRAALETLRGTEGL